MCVNTAQVYTTSSDLNPSNNMDIASIAIYTFDLSVEITDTIDPVKLASETTFNISVHNSSAGSVNGVIVTNYLPVSYLEPTDFISISVGSVSVNQNLLTWNIGSISAGKTEMVSFKSKAIKGPATVESYSMLSSYGVDENYQNSSDNEETTIYVEEFDISDLVISTDWVFDRQCGWFVGTVSFSNPSNSLFYYESPFWFALPKTSKYWLQYPDGRTADGMDYVDVTTQAENALYRTGNRDNKLNPGESIVVSGILLTQAEKENSRGFVYANSVNVAVAYPTTDYDADTMDDAWEWSYLKNLTGLSATGDYDNDKFIDINEYKAGTSSVDSGSYLGFSKIESKNGGVKLYWQTVAGKSYKVEEIDIKTGKVIRSVLYASGSVLSVFDDDMNDGAIYRLKLQE